MGCLWSSQPVSRATLQEEVEEAFEEIPWKELPPLWILSFFRPFFLGFLQDASSDDLARVLRRLDHLANSSVVSRTKTGITKQSVKEMEANLLQLQNRMMTRSQTAKKSEN